MSTGNPLMVALEAAYRARQGVRADPDPEGSMFAPYREALNALWLACDAAWGPTQQLEPCPVCGKVAHENWCSTQADY